MPHFDALLPHLPAWLLVLFRLTGLFILAPMLGSSTVPARYRILFALSLSFVIYPMLLEPTRPSAPHVVSVMIHGLGLWSLFPIIATEMLIGFVIGFGAMLPLIGMQMAGRIVDQQLGLGLAGVFNPELDDESGVVGQFYFITALMIFIIIGGHRVMVMTLVGSFDRVPLGGFVPDDRTLYLVTGILTTIFELALRVAAPLLCVIFLETVAIGFIARTVPQMNILSIGFPLRILMGTALIIGTISVQINVFEDHASWILGGIAEFIDTWSPP